MDIKQLWKQHQNAILCVVAILALAFPLIRITSDYSDVSITGFGAIEESFFALLLIILPALLAASSYVASLKKYQPVLNIGVPVFCFLLLILVFFTCKSAATAGSDMFGSFGVEVNVRPGFCAVLATLSYIAMGVFWFQNRKVSGNVPKVNTSAILENVQEKAAQVADYVKTAASDVAASHASADTSVPIKKSVSINRTNEILALIEKLSAMKDAGVLTEEEFSEKKEALLEEI